MLYHFKELTSTIDEARSGGYSHGDIVVADHQTAGRGQRGHDWHSAAGQNLLFSVVLDTSFLRAGEQFVLLQAVALSLAELMEAHGLEARIKWTNDIYIADRKVVGVLIDHTIGPDGRLVRSGVGVGINVNQTEFDPTLPNPTSMALELGRELDRMEVLERFRTILMARIDSMRDGQLAELQRDYHRRIYRLGLVSRFWLPEKGAGVAGGSGGAGSAGDAGGREILGTIHGVAPTGELLVEHADGTRRGYLYSEISLIV